MSVWRAGRVTVDDGVALAHDRGLLLGDGLYETLLVVRGRAPLLARHLDRMEKSGEALGIARPADFRAVIEAAIPRLWTREERPARAWLRVVLSRGSGRGLDVPAGGTPGLLLLLGALPAVDAGAPAPPARAAAVAAPRIDPRDPLAQHKTLSSMSRVVARASARASGADLALITTSQGDPCEADAANLFLVRDGVTLTPPLDRGVLPGITRARCLEALTGAGRPVEERTLSLGDFAVASEAFVTSSLTGVRPLSHVSGSPLPEAPGAVSVWLAGCLDQDAAGVIPTGGRSRTAAERRGEQP